MILWQDTSISLTDGETRAVLGFAGLCVAVGLRIMWQKAKDFRDVADRTRAIDQTLHGDPKAHEPNGLVRKLNHVAGRMDTLATHFERHTVAEAVLVEEGNRLRSEANNRLHLRLIAIEERLPHKKPPRRSA